MKVKFLQQGGQAPEGQAAPAQGGAPEEQIAQMAQQIIEQVGPEGAAMLAQIIMQMLEGAAQQAPQGQPVMQRNGGKLQLVGRK
jgi:hypothetical protein